MDFKLTVFKFYMSSVSWPMDVKSALLKIIIVCLVLYGTWTSS